jgi:hypothetical protein
MMDAYPLHWPEGWPRTKNPQTSRFNTASRHVIVQCLMDEIRRMGGRNTIVSTNVRLRNDGLPYASDKPPVDKGVAAYFTYKGKPMVFACDKWDKVEDNTQSIRKTIEALRGIERWGASDMMERAFSGFQAIEGPKDETPWNILRVPTDASPGELRAARNRLAQIYHPDSGSSPDAAMMSKINTAYEAATMFDK